MRKSRGPQSQETKDKIRAAHKASGHRPDPSVVDLDKARKVRWGKHVKDIAGTLFGIYKSSARSRKFEFTIPRADFDKLIQAPCFYCGDPPEKRIINKEILICNGID